MYKVVGVCRAKGGRVREAMAALKQVVEFEKKFNVKVEVYAQQFGPAGTIYLMADYPDLASVEATRARMTADPDYLAVMHVMLEAIDPPTTALLQHV